MFQYACGRSVAHARRLPLKLDLSWFDGQCLRRYGLDGFRISANIATGAELRRFHRRARFHGWLARPIAAALPGGRYTVMQERSFAYDADVSDLEGNVLLDGYWQSERYFSNIAEIIRQDFRLRAPESPFHRAWAEEIRNVNAISVHVRRGDYISNPDVRHVHGTCDPSYYERAATQIARDESDPQFFIFSDDPRWARQNLRLPYPAKVVERTGTPNDCEDLILMSLCRHSIIANSSFSWWAAWLGGFPGRKVIAPRKWFNVDAHETRDLIPARWMRT